MRYSLLAATLIAFGTTVAMPANACCVQHPPNASVPEWMPQMQKDAGETVMPQILKDDHVTAAIAGTTAAPSGISDQKIERYAFQGPQTQKGDTLALLGSHQVSPPVITGNNITRGIPSEGSGQHQPMQKDASQKLNTGEGVTTGSAGSHDAGSHDAMPRWYLRSEAPTLPPGTGPG